jgi:hypothetical protein
MLSTYGLREQIERLRQEPYFRAYEDVRERVLRMKELESGSRPGVEEPSEYWREELANFDYMLDASPLIIAKLRHHCYHITGLRVYDYRSNRDSARELFANKLRALVEIGGEELLIAEPSILGGFGFEIDGGLYNIDTLKFYEVLVAMRQGHILDPFAKSDERRVVWEIGAGWGGFAYQFKTLFPNVTYVISDFPELFLFSAVYLKAAFPQARLGFYGDEPLEQLLARWRELDFVFVPNWALDELQLPHLDATVNMVSFQEMTTEQVAAYVRHSAHLEAPHLYSLNRDRSPYNLELTSVPSIIEQFYVPEEISVLPVSYTKIPDKPGKHERSGLRRLYDLWWGRGAPKAKAKVDKATLDYRHIVGRRRSSA